jgi:hypothetical protein
MALRLDGGLGVGPGPETRGWPGRYTRTGCEGLGQVLGARLPGAKEKDLERAGDLRTPCHLVMKWKEARDPELWSGNWELAYYREKWEERLEFSVPVQSRALGKVTVFTKPASTSRPEVVVARSDDFKRLIFWEKVEEGGLRRELTFGEDGVVLVTSVLGTDTSSKEVFQRKPEHASSS